MDNQTLSALNDLRSRLTRTESKLVRGFEELGINIDTDHDWMSVEEDSRTVYISTMGRSLAVILTDMKRHGAKQTGKVYDLVHKGEVVGTLLYKGFP